MRVSAAWFDSTARSKSLEKERRLGSQNPLEDPGRASRWPGLLSPGEQVASTQGKVANSLIELHFLKATAEAQRQKETMPHASRVLLRVVRDVPRHVAGKCGHAARAPVAVTARAWRQGAPPAESRAPATLHTMDTADQATQSSESVPAESHGTARVRIEAQQNQPAFAGGQLSKASARWRLRARPESCQACKHTTMRQQLHERKMTHFPPQLLASSIGHDCRILASLRNSTLKCHKQR